MDMTGEQRIPAPREAVWRALNDADVLRRCIPGCQELTMHSDTEMSMVAVIKVGPISARFQGAVTLSELDPPNGYRIVGEGQGGVAGHARGGALVKLVDDGEGTLLTYVVSAQIGGKLAQLGGRMIDATAKSMSAAFFRKFAEEIASPTGAAPLPPAAAAIAAPVAAYAPAGVPMAAPASNWGSQLAYLLAGLVIGYIALRFVGAVPGAPADLHTLFDLALAGIAGFCLGRRPTVVIRS
ncbi:carbon monoxide dehydrogenase subunit G [Novosphingobium sp. PASSN1]|uniref:SRPBCC family protein n=1 Tax=Novosphingobium sp. PASSN1 TaxID=2015561 RepID=UPI000BD5C868|nr:carbon monoxide dehydrogenase subunit G [Novosphingobium sp. PASSN1]OYU35708.1 MAG: carbon monoxide dehydrogenase [Novosphingobium sp. PASSN1]